MPKDNTVDELRAELTHYKDAYGLLVTKGVSNSPEANAIYKKITKLEDMLEIEYIRGQIKKSQKEEMKTRDAIEEHDREVRNQLLDEIEGEAHNVHPGFGKCVPLEIIKSKRSE